MSVFIVGLIVLAAVTLLAVAAAGGLAMFLAKTAQANRTRQGFGVETGAAGRGVVAVPVGERRCARPGCDATNPVDAKNCRRCGVELGGGGKA